MTNLGGFDSSIQFDYLSHRRFSHRRFGAAAAAHQCSAARHCCATTTVAQAPLALAKPQCEEWTSWFVYYIILHYHTPAYLSRADFRELAEGRLSGRWQGATEHGRALRGNGLNDSDNDKYIFLSLSLSMHMYIYIYIYIIYIER